MARSVRHLVAKELAEVMKSPHTKEITSEELLQKLTWCVRTPTTWKKVPDTVMLVPFKNLRTAGLIPQVKYKELQQYVTEVVSQSEHVKIGAESLVVRVQREKFVKLILSDIVHSKDLNSLCSDLMKYKVSDDKTLTQGKQNQRVVIEYSSPNIAKPFHAGHLRSTVLGNVLGNLYEYFGHQVTRLNYFGDWGTQFGYIGVGLKKYFSQEEFEASPLNHYYEVYVKANEASKSDRTFHNQAMQFFSKMEQGCAEELEVWRKCRECSIQEYQKTYKRLGVKFDEYHSESMYKDEAFSVVEQLKKNGVVHTDRKTGMLFMETEVPYKDQPIKIPLVKRDGSTLYVTRDIAAAIHRNETYKFDHMLYLVEHTQHEHFTNMLLCLQAMGHAFAQRPVKHFHVGFGRVEGMSTRKGTAVFLSDILDKGQELMVQSMRKTETTKVEDPDEFHQIADTLAVSAIVVQDFKDRRLKPYQFDWKRMLQFKGNTGVYLQYTHARLCSLMRKSLDCGIVLDVNCDTSVLTEAAAVNLVMSLAQFDQAVYSAYSEHEPCYIVEFLFNVCRFIARALESLPVKDQPEDIAKARLLLFYASRVLIAEGLQLIGLTPLEKM